MDFYLSSLSLACGISLMNTKRLFVEIYLQQKHRNTIKCAENRNEEKEVMLQTIPLFPLNCIADARFYALCLLLVCAYFAKQHFQSNANG